MSVYLCCELQTRRLSADRGGQDIFDVDPLRGVVAGVAGGAEARFLFALFLVLGGLQQTVKRQIGQ